MKRNALIPELNVSNLTLSVNFYTKLLGFSIEYARKEDGFVFLSRGKAQLMLDQLGVGRTWETGDMSLPLGRGMNLQIQVDSIAPLVTALNEQGIDLFLQPEEKWYRVEDSFVGSKQFAVQDPDGYLLRFFEDIGRKPL